MLKQTRLVRTRYKVHQSALFKLKL